LDDHLAGVNLYLFFAGKICRQKIRGKTIVRKRETGLKTAYVNKKHE
jgi:hypothetical protein